MVCGQEGLGVKDKLARLHPGFGMVQKTSAPLGRGFILSQPIKGAGQHIVGK